MFGGPGSPFLKTALPGTAQNFALFFPSPVAKFVLFFPSLGVFSLNFGVFEGRDPQMCTFGLSDCRVKPRRLWGRRDFTRQFQTRTFERPGASNTTKIP